MSPEQYTRFIKAETARLGFDYCGIARAVQLDEDARRLEQWLNKGMHGSMRYMENHFDLRIDPGKLVPGARSVITLLLNYYPATEQQPGAPMVSKYAYGKDYHKIIKNKLKELLSRIHDEIGEVQGRGFVDSAPVLERSWAQRSGLGWIGKNGNLIHKGAGSFFFIATLIVDLPLLYDDPVAADFCGSCTRCLDACPTGALPAPRVVDGSRCISYYTIELKEQLIPEQMQEKFGDWMFGCDICQDVCPWNRFSKATGEAALEPLPEILNFSTRDWEALTEEKFSEIFRHSPLKRAGYAGIRRNLRLRQI
ncbi:tRNA epoxyqueuosine(34) reductase QueG [Compostibacter hankyongensis]|uniref:Epoxyqueuosine reductase n=1 Tax=Compostibacter hankyongensis TaxID=1007089 RepID=A0ABP8FQC0_9BACT